MRSLALIVCALVLGGCAVTNTSYPSVAMNAPTAHASPAPPPSAFNYASVPRAPLHSELFACYRGGSNLGEIGLRGEAALYTPYMETPAGSLLRNPTEAACISSGFGWRNMSRRQHNGVDLANPNGGFVYAAGAGRIAIAGLRGGYGNFVEIDHGRGVQTRYAHMAELNPELRPGMRIDEGVPIGRMGMTGNATGVHLHYEVLVDGLLVDPIHFGVPSHYQTTPVTQTFPDPISLPPPENVH